MAESLSKLVYYTQNIKLYFCFRDGKIKGLITLLAP